MYQCENEISIMRRLLALCIIGKAVLYVDNIRAVIVDDSSVSIAIINEIFEHHGFEVVGTAGSLKEVKKVVKDTKPNLVTMDISLPDADGFECIRAIHEIDPTIKVIVVSSMMDDGSIGEAYQHSVSSYIQKPIEEEDLLNAINEIKTDDEMFNTLQKEYLEVFKKSFEDGYARMVKGSFSYESNSVFDKELTSEDIVIVVGIVGKFSGKMVLMLPRQVSVALSDAFLKRAPKDDEELSDILTEFANIISGSACSTLNRKNGAYNLRLAPPSIMIGPYICISPPNFTMHTAIANTDFGKILLNIGFKRGI